VPVEVLSGPVLAHGGARVGVAGSDGHEHSYKSEYVDGWNAVMRAGLTQDQLASLREIISAVNQ